MSLLYENTLLPGKMKILDSSHMLHVGVLVYDIRAVEV
jgi:hypothetical protein